MRILSVETSCDETAVSILDGNRVRSSAVYSQLKEHRPFGGVVPEIASRAHVAKIHPVLKEALETAKADIDSVDIIAATAGPGLVGALAVGFSFGRGLALSLGVPFIGVHHLEAHLFANALDREALRPPFVALIISGGHTELIDVPEEFEYVLWSRTRDDAAGEAFDKTGKQLGLPYPSGKIMGDLAKEGDAQFLKLPRPLKKERDFSFSGLKTAVRNAIHRHPPEWAQSNLAGICASVQEAIVDTLLAKASRAMKDLSRDRLVLAGGVACNQRLREKLETKAGKEGFTWMAPPPVYCTDNAAMVGAAAFYRYGRYGEQTGYERVFPTMQWDEFGAGTLKRKG